MAKTSFKKKPKSPSTQKATAAKKPEQPLPLMLQAGGGRGRGGGGGGGKRNNNQDGDGIGQLFAYQSAAQLLTASPTAISFDAVTIRNSQFKVVQNGGTTFIARSCGKGIATFLVTFTYAAPIQEDLFTAYLTLNGNVIPGSIVQRVSLAGRTFILSGTLQAKIRVRRGDSIQAVAISSSGLGQLPVTTVGSTTSGTAISATLI